MYGAGISRVQTRRPIPEPKLFFTVAKRLIHYNLSTDAVLVLKHDSFDFEESISVQVA